MCAGAILKAGFNVGVSAIDQSAGINFDERFALTAIPGSLREATRASFGYYGVQAPVSQPYRGSQQVIFSGEQITARNYLLSRAIFTESLSKVRKINNRAGIGLADLENPKHYRYIQVRIPLHGVLEQLDLRQS
jgi:cytosine deaminase